MPCESCDFTGSNCLIYTKSRNIRKSGEIINKIEENRNHHIVSIDTESGLVFPILTIQNRYTGKKGVNRFITILLRNLNKHMKSMLCTVTLYN